MYLISLITMCTIFPLTFDNEVNVDRTKQRGLFLFSENVNLVKLV